ncbi:MAG: UvrB/UvrC motif-containing protein [Gracilibacteraceae bacterium]|jgi:protein arginine kinase activator|nr:UvrB/UvrC motif-containing protein [Gracilibacteraceae bacterium]
MICQKCQVRQASVHVQQHVNGKLSETYLCQQCAHDLKQSGFSYPALVAGFLQSLLGASAANAMQETGQETAADACPTCHTSAARIQHTGFVGCADCYEHFARQMDSWLRRIQGQVRHAGKAPQRCEAAIQEAATLEQLKTKLKTSIEAEAFEEAAVLRDRIRELEDRTKGENADGQTTCQTR